MRENRLGRGLGAIGKRACQFFFLAVPEIDLAGLARRSAPAVVQAAQVVADGRQRELDAHPLQTAQSKLSHPALLLENPEHRFDDRLAQTVDRSARCTAQFQPHPSMLAVE